MNVNSQYFSEEQIKDGQMQKFIELLTSEAYAAGDYFNDLHIYPADCGAFIVEWIQIPWDRSFGGRFEYIDDDKVVMLEKSFPDNHYEYFIDEDDYLERLNEWLEENPGWVKTEYGTWTNEIENAAFRKELEKFDNDDAAQHYENGIPQAE